MQSRLSLSKALRMTSQPMKDFPVVVGATLFEGERTLPLQHPMLAGPLEEREGQDWGQATGSVSDPEDCRRDAVAAGFEIVRLARFPIVDWTLYELVVRKPVD